ncbi:hypothetical protein Dole_0764 [Desulfosudis oleivorans Hxd3]|uniref:Uncharacterized protein n=2 Tax=Desulfosudis TaxID=2904716 RepID=A8ZVB3_DESOH|nr:hypothetical protein Dole_0764 [Desulfosudis oleivorans Hxd3]
MRGLSMGDEKPRLSKGLFRFLRTGECGTRSHILLLLALCAILGAGVFDPCALYATEDITDNAEIQSAYQGAQVKEAPSAAPGVVNAVITDRGAVINGNRNRDALEIRPFQEAWTGFVAVKNTGTTFIDHFRISFTCPMEDSDAISLDLISPSMPSWIWRPLVGDMLSLCTRDMDFTILNNRVEVRDATTSARIAVAGLYPSSPLGPEGLAPGQTLLIEYTEPYSDCLNGFVQSIATRKKMDFQTEIADRENNIMHMRIKKYKVAFLTFDQVVVAITFKGAGAYASCSLDLSIDNKLYDAVPWVAYEWK